MHLVLTSRSRAATAAHLLREYRPLLESLEGRLPPGDALGGLMAWSALGPLGLLLSPDPWSARDAVAAGAPADARPSRGRLLPDRGEAAGIIRGPFFSSGAPARGVSDTARQETDLTAAGAEDGPAAWPAGGATEAGRGPDSSDVRPERVPAAEGGPRGPGVPSPAPAPDRAGGRTEVPLPAAGTALAGQATLEALAAALQAAGPRGTPGGARSGDASPLPAPPAADGPPPGQTAVVVPAQFMAKMYTEALGRVPDQAGWNGGVTYFQAAGCNHNSLWAWGNQRYNVPEYLGLGYDNASRLLTLFRGVLNREPDVATFNDWWGELNGGRPWGQVVDAFFGLTIPGRPPFTEFQNTVVPRICANPAYGFGPGAVMNNPTHFPEMTAAAALSLVNAGQCLPQKTVVRLSAATGKFIIPEGKTLQTCGLDNRRQYAKMARFVRDTNFSDITIQVSGGAALYRTWVDGARGRHGFNFNASAVTLTGGTNTAVSESRITDSAGWTSVYLSGQRSGSACQGNAVYGTLVTVYASDYVNLTDGISVECHDSDIVSNEVIDTPDAGIAVFDDRPLPPATTDALQTSLVYGNVVLSAGLIANSALALDPRYPLHPNDPAPKPHEPDTNYDWGFANATPDYAWLQDNVVWNGPDTGYRIAISVGTRAYFDGGSYMGWGSLVYANRHYDSSVTREQAPRLRANMVIGVSGMRAATVIENDMLFDYVRFCGCPNVPVGVDMRYAQYGAFQPWLPAQFDRCILNPP